MPQTIPGQQSIFATASKRAAAVSAKVDLSAKEYICAIWARKALSYDLIEDAMFRTHFGPCIPLGFGRQELRFVHTFASMFCAVLNSTEMKLLAKKIDALVLQKVGNAVGTLGVDGWTNVRHKYVPAAFRSTFFIILVSGRCTTSS